LKSGTIEVSENAPYFGNFDDSNGLAWFRSLRRAFQRDLSGHGNQLCGNAVARAFLSSLLRSNRSSLMGLPGLRNPEPSFASNVCLGIGRQLRRVTIWYMLWSPLAHSLIYVLR
jgi:hypothetical protein